MRTAAEGIGDGAGLASAEQPAHAAREHALLALSFRKYRETRNPEPPLDSCVC